MKQIRSIAKDMEKAYLSGNGYYIGHEELKLMIRVLCTSHTAIESERELLRNHEGEPRCGNCADNMRCFAAYRVTVCDNWHIAPKWNGKD